MADRTTIYLNDEDATAYHKLVTHLQKTTKNARPFSAWVCGIVRDAAAKLPSAKKAKAK